MNGGRRRGSDLLAGDTILCWIRMIVMLVMWWVGCHRCHPSIHDGVVNDDIVVDVDADAGVSPGVTLCVSSPALCESEEEQSRAEAPMLARQATSMD